MNQMKKRFLITISALCLVWLVVFSISGLHKARMSANASFAIGNLLNFNTSQACFGEAAKLNNGIAKKNGYYFICYMPRENGIYTRETYPLPKVTKIILEKEKAIEQKAINHQEKKFIVYAWPIKYGDSNSGTKVFFVDAGDEVLSASNELTKYSGLDKIPGPQAALQKNGRSIAGIKAGDGQIWRSVRN